MEESHPALFAAQAHIVSDSEAMDTTEKDGNAYIFYNALLGTYSSAVFEDMLREVDVGHRGPILDLLDSMGDLSLRVYAHRDGQRARWLRGGRRR
jgi:hypothetical protein